MKKPRRHRIFKIFSAVYYIGIYLMFLDIDNIFMSTISYILSSPFIFIPWLLIYGMVKDNGKPTTDAWPYRWF